MNVFGRPPLYFGESEPKPSVLKLWITSLIRSALVKVTSAIFTTGMPCADSRIIWARRQVTTDPVPLRMIRSSRRPSSSIDLPDTYSLCDENSMACPRRRTDTRTARHNRATLPDAALVQERRRANVVPHMTLPVLAPSYRHA